MKIEDTKLWKEFKEWLFKYGFSGRTFRDMYFEGKEGYYRAFLRERGFKVDMIETANNKVFGRCVRPNDYTIFTKSYNSYPEAFMNLVTEIFNKP